MSERAPGDGTDDDETVVDKLEELAALAVLGVGLVALFLGYSWFWLVFAVGFAVVVPMVHVLADLLTTEAVSDGAADADGDAGDDALEALKRQYARGEIDEAEFERRLEVLVDADSPDDVASRLERRREDAATDLEAGERGTPRERPGVEDRELER